MKVQYYSIQIQVNLTRSNKKYAMSQTCAQHI